MTMHRQSAVDYFIGEFIKFDSSCPSCLRGAIPPPEIVSQLFLPRSHEELQDHTLDSVFEQGNVEVD